MSEQIKNNKILLTEEDATLFIAYKKNRNKFIILLKSGVFDLNSGKIEINVNNKQFQNIHIHKLVFKRTETGGIIME